MTRNLDLSVSQDLFHNVGGQKNAFQIRLDILNLGNLLNSNWGVQQRPVGTVNTNQQLQVLTNPGVDAQGRANYRLQVVNNELIKKTFQTSATTGDVYQFMLSLRYSRSTESLAAGLRPASSLSRAASIARAFHCGYSAAPDPGARGHLPAPVALALERAAASSRHAARGRR